MAQDAVVVSGVSKRFGSTLAVDDVSFTVGHGELVGIAGHNGAGKSTILNIVTGRLAGDSGTISIAGVERPAAGLPRRAGQLGVRVVHQELSLCPTLRVDETAAVFDHSVGGARWRTAAWRRLKAVLDEMFPEHGIQRGRQIKELSISRRQMIECACSMLPGETEPSLVVLDEPTSSLDASMTTTFYGYLHRRADIGLSAIVTTHRINEMIENLSRVYIMRDGRILSEQRAADATKESLVRAMGVGGHESNDLRPASHAATQAQAKTSETVRVNILERDPDGTESSYDLYEGEIVGLAGLEGHGQVEILEAMFKSATSPLSGAKRTLHQSVKATGKGAYVSGDRGVRGIFRYWDVSTNMTISHLKSLSRAGFISRVAETRLVDQWWGQLGIKGSPHDPILSLSGGTQQKALMARALSLDSDVLLLEDPTRGVDQSTKEDVYSLLREQAKNGQCVIWYSTENEELRNCDRVLVFRSGRMVAALDGADATEDTIIASSFSGREA